MMALATILLAATFTRPLERVTTMDPAMAQSVYESRAVQLVYETILSIDYMARPYRLVAGACELPEVSTNGLRYVFRVRSKELTAEEIVRSLERLRDPELVSPNGWMLKSVDTIRALDLKTVEIRLVRKCHFFPWLMAMSQTGVRRADGSGTGPYELVSWWKNHEMVFTRRKGVVAPPDGFDTIRYLVVDDASTKWLMFLKGELDFLSEVSRDNWDAVVDANGNLDPKLYARGIRMYSNSTLESIYIGMNMRDPVLGPNRKLRQALNAAFDYPRWEKFYSGRIVQSTGPVPPGVVEGRLETPFAYSFNIEKARQLMVEAGYPNGIDPTTGRRLTLTLAIGRASQDTREIGELLAAFYDRIGIRLELSFHTWNAFLKAVDEGRVQLFNMGWVGDYPDAENFLQLFHSKNMSPGPNHANYVNPAYDREYDLAMMAETAVERNRHWLKCQEILREDCPWVFTHFNLVNSLVGPRVGNYIPSCFPYGQEQYFKAVVK